MPRGSWGESGGDWGARSVGSTAPATFAVPPAWLLITHWAVLFGIIWGIGRMMRRWLPMIYDFHLEVPAVIGPLVWYAIASAGGYWASVGWAALAATLLTAGILGTALLVKRLCGRGWAGRGSKAIAFLAVEMLLIGWAGLAFLLLFLDTLRIVQ